MSDHVQTRVFLQIKPDRLPSGMVIGAKVIKMTLNRPDTTTQGASVVKLILNLPKALFEPTEVEADLEYYEDGEVIANIEGVPPSSP